MLFLLLFIMSSVCALAQEKIFRPVKIDASYFLPDGSLADTKLAQWLSDAYKEKKLNNAAFNSPTCLKVKNLGTGGGYNTLQLFLVSSTWI